MSPDGAGAARRRARRRRGRPQPAQVAGPGHPRREARRARGRAVVRASRRCPGWRSSSAFLFWPFEYVAPGEPGYVDLRALHAGHRGHLRASRCSRSGIGVIALREEVLPGRGVGPAAARRRRPTRSPARPSWRSWPRPGKDTGIAPPQADHPLGRRAPAGIFGLGLGVAAIAPLVRNPWKGGADAALWITGWKPGATARPSTCAATPAIPDEISLVRPEDQDAGSMETVFPFRESERGDEEALLRGAARARTTR